MRRLLLPGLALFLLLVGCGEDNSPMTTPMPPGGPGGHAPADTTLSYLALGDSYTIGTSVAADERWPNQLAEQLLQRERIRISPLEIIARNGWRTDNLSNALAAAPPGTTFDLVSLLIGVNDQYQGFAVEGYRERFEELLKDAIAYGGGDTARVFLVSIPDYAYTPFGGGNQRISKDIDAFNAAAREIANDYDVSFYSITDISRRGLVEPTLVAEDKLHPSGLQYRRWVEEVLLAQVARQIRRD